MTVSPGEEGGEREAGEEAGPSRREEPHRRRADEARRAGREGEAAAGPRRQEERSSTGWAQTHPGTHPAGRFPSHIHPFVYFPGREGAAPMCFT